MPLATCPICGAKFDLNQSPSSPFCSARCRRVDLGRWLNEEYTVPDAPDEEPEDDEPPSQPPDGDSD